MNEKKNESKQKRGLNWFFKVQIYQGARGEWGGLNIPCSKRESHEYR